MPEVQHQSVVPSRDVLQPVDRGKPEAGGFLSAAYDSQARYRDVSWSTRAVLNPVDHQD